MKRALPIVLLLVGALATLAGEKGGAIHLRVTQADGAVREGVAVFKKDALELDSKKIPWSRIAEIEELDADAPPPAIERSRDEASFADREQALEKKTDEPKALARQWTRLGEWARRRALADEAKRAFEKAVAQDPDEGDAERALGRAKDDDGAWANAEEVFAKKKAATPADPAKLLDLARWAARNGLAERALEAIVPLNKKNPFDRKLLSFIRPLTDRHRQASAIVFPLRGSWRANRDTTHHHEAKSYAVYALDFYAEVDGRPWKGDGKALEDHYAWGQEIHAVADGEVIGSTDGYPDNPPLKIPAGDLQMKNNGVAVLHSGGEASWYLHMQKGSVRVKIGQHVKKGDVLGLVGNSGASAEPHLHFTLVDRQRLSIPWCCEGWTLVADDGSKVRVRRGRILEGMLVENQ